jgi:hypothetical protein
MAASPLLCSPPLHLEKETTVATTSSYQFGGPHLCRTLEVSSVHQLPRIMGARDPIHVSPTPSEALPVLATVIGYGR